ncbi:MAG: hypothetical protein KAJ19_15755 [Gammaproteobacteria bacterium]|nr:hypothetical protein [Gammaproteobacteria bacterium]
MTELLAGVAYFVFVFFKAIQQRNVAFLHYKWVLPTSYCMSTTELIVISVIALKAVNSESWMDMIPMVLTVGTGGGLGAIVAMYLHNRYIK